MSKRTLTPADVRMAGKLGKQEIPMALADTQAYGRLSVTCDSGFGDKQVYWLRAQAVTPALQAQVDAQLSTAGKPLWRHNDRRAGWWAYASDSAAAFLATLGVPVKQAHVPASTPASASTPKAAPPAKPKAQAKPKGKAQAQAQAPAQASAPVTLADLTTEELVTRIDRRMAEINLLVKELQARTQGA